jgi:RNA polymerase sigma factor (sigma-70 family)
MDIRYSGRETKIIEGCLQNDRKAQKLLYDRYKDAMYTVAYRLLRNEDEACDAVQEGFIDVFRSLNQFKNQSTPGAWIKTIVLRKCFRRISKQRDYEDLENVPLATDENHRMELTGEVLDMAIARLSPGFRQVFILVEVEGYAHKEVAKMLNISEGTSKSQLSRAKALLQKMLKEYKLN